MLQPSQGTVWHKSLRPFQNGCPDHSAMSNSHTTRARRRFSRITAWSHWRYSTS